MSRKDLKPKAMEDETLRALVWSYQDAKKEESVVKKLIAEKGATIKQELQNRDVTEFIAGDVRASITVTPNQEVNELQAIEILRKALTPEQFSKVVKTREYIDDDEFEKLVYAHEVDAEILQPAVTPKAPTVTLRLGKVKK
jgi:Zn-dependent metalloprotease